MRAGHELFEVGVPARRIICRNCGHVINASDFSIDDPQEVRAICQYCHADLLRISWGQAVQGVK